MLVLTQIIRVTQNHIHIRQQRILFKKQVGDLADIEIQKEDFEIQRKVYRSLIKWLDNKEVES